MIILPSVDVNIGTEGRTRGSWVPQAPLLSDPGELGASSPPYSPTRGSWVALEVNA